MAVASGTVTLNASTPTLVCTMGAGGALVFTPATALTVFIGGANVSTSGTAAGVPLPQNQYVQVPGGAAADIPVVGGGINSAALYAIATTGTPSISFIAAPGAGG